MTVEMSGNIEIERRAYGSPEVKRLMEDAHREGLRAALEAVEENMLKGEPMMHKEAIERLLAGEEQGKDQYERGINAAIGAVQTRADDEPWGAVHAGLELAERAIERLLEGGDGS